jgi:lipopolysaccharide export LptBFGC system permease protein LptF
MWGTGMRAGGMRPWRIVAIAMTPLAVIVGAVVACVAGVILALMDDEYDD